jgi:uncharacterized Fe-S cluster-containing MiaB family protein
MSSQDKHITNSHTKGALWDLRLSEQSCSRVETCGMCGRVAECTPPDVSKNRISHIFRVKKSKTTGIYWCD